MLVSKLLNVTHGGEMMLVAIKLCFYVGFHSLLDVVIMGLNKQKVICFANGKTIANFVATLKESMKFDLSSGCDR